MHPFTLYITKPNTCGIFDCFLSIIVDTSFSFVSFALILAFVYFTLEQLENKEPSSFSIRLKLLSQGWVSALLIAFINELRIIVIDHFFLS